jgi:hypothetical protein
MKYYKLFGWTITTDKYFEYATANPPKYCFKIPWLSIIFVKW